MEKSNKGGDHKKFASTKIFPKSNQANIASVPNTVGDVKPTFGVRMKSTLKLKEPGSRNFASNMSQVSKDYSQEKELSVDEISMNNVQGTKRGLV